jgi:hypothetical protein
LYGSPFSSYKQGGEKKVEQKGVAKKQKNAGTIRLGVGHNARDGVESKNNSARVGRRRERGAHGWVANQASGCSMYCEMKGGAPKWITTNARRYMRQEYEINKQSIICMWVRSGSVVYMLTFLLCRNCNFTRSVTPTTRE